LFVRSAAMRAIRGLAEKISRTKVPILLCGDAGTGKEALARWIHQNSNYSAGAFVKVNCAAICGTLLESELFGYERGAFTGADQSKPGRVELAEGGTLFLDEIAELDLNLQSKLLHFLQDGAFSRLADHTERRVDTRVICATNKDLDQEVHEGRFRQDLFYRIYGFRIKMPSLRERRADARISAKHELEWKRTGTLERHRSVRVNRARSRNGAGSWQEMGLEGEVQI
jgi:transcriptional regulator with GAF, ATPase, and Fis domain